jgi:hypothetical protein
MNWLKAENGICWVKGKVYFVNSKSGRNRTDFARLGARGRQRGRQRTKSYKKEGDGFAPSFDLALQRDER